MFHVLAAALGLSVIVAQSAIAFNFVKFVGAAYLIYLGIPLLLKKGEALIVQPTASHGVRRAFLDGYAWRR